MMVPFMSRPKTLCLNMIVKNEMANLERCLSAVADHISCWVIGDTGSTDGTQKFIERFFAERGIPGELHSFPFENFAQARNEALDRARASALHFDYLLLTDADMELMVQNLGFSNDLTASAYKVLQNSSVTYWNNRLLRRDVPAGYRGVTHEYLDVREGETKNLDGIRFIDHATGANRVDKYERDVRLLTDAIVTERDPGMIARYTFYLANTLRDSGQREAALETYLKRARLGNWQQEVFMSLLNVAKLKEVLEYSNDEVISAYMAANVACPTRAEALHGAARFCRNRRIYGQGYDFAAQGLTIHYPTDALFVEDWIYAYGLLDELAVNAYWTERYAECVDACDRLLIEGKLPTDQRDRVLKNKNFAIGKLGEVVAPPSGEADIFIKLLRSARLKEELVRPDDEIISAYMAATAACPTRAEALHGAARYCRVRGMNERGYEFAAQGLAIACPKDALAVEDWIYEYGLQQEFSIVANYSRDPARKDRGFASCNWLALNRTVPEGPRNLALSNLHFYIEPVAKMMPSFAARPVGFAPPDGYRPTNPSIACHGDEIVLVQRAVNYTIDQAMPEGDDRRYAAPDGAPINTRNFLLRMDGDFAIRSSTEILPPEDMPKPVWPLARGFEDLRPFVWRDGLWCIACVRELSHEGWCEQVLARIDEPTPGASRLVDWRVLRPEGPQRHEKNWMPRVAGDALQFIYLCDPTRLVDEQARTVVETIPPVAANQFRGSSQAIAFDRGWLALVHEARVRDKQRHYRHRFVWFNEASQLRKVSRPFFFHKRGVEFAAGLAWHPDRKRLVVTYGIGDSEAWIATVDADDVRRVLEDAGQLPPKSGSSISEVRQLNQVNVDVDDSRPSAQGLERVLLNTEQSRRVENDTIDAISESLVEGKTWVTPPQAVRREGEFELPVAAYVEAGIASLPAPTQRIKSRLEQRNANQSEDFGTAPEIESNDAMKSPEEKFLSFAPFLRTTDSPNHRRDLSRAFDARIAPFINDHDSAVLPKIHCFYEVMSETAEHVSLIAAIQSMRAVGHSVRVWSYAPAKIEFLARYGVELYDAAGVVPKGLFERIVVRSEIRYFSDIFRYAALYEHGGLWMDTDVVMVRPFPFRGDYFFNLQWQDAGKGHFVCGNVIYAKPYSRHMRALYEQALERFFAAHDTTFGDIGPKLLSDYIASDEGAALQEWLFSPMFFNSLDWTEVERFNQPIDTLADYLNDERITGIHLWNARTHSAARDADRSLIATLSAPHERMPSFASLADRFNTDKNRHTGNRHCYARIYDRLLGSQQFALRRLMEIGLCRGLAEKNQPETPSVALWQSYFPFCHVVGVDLTDFSSLNNVRFTSLVCDQSKRDELREVVAKLAPGSFDVIIDDGSHASADEQLTLVEFFPLLADGGWYFIEDLDWQPPGEDRGKIALTKTLLREIQEHGTARSIDPLGVTALADQFADILFFDSHYELSRARLMGGLVAIRKSGGSNR